MSSLRQPDNSNTEWFEDSNTIADTASIEVTTLDKIFSDHINTQGFKNIFLKIDTQGYDLEVLKGGKQSLKDIKVIQSELSFVALYEKMPGALEVIDYLQNKSFVMVGLYKVNDAGYPLQMFEADGIFVSTNYDG